MPFENAFEATMGNEGGYSNDPSDRGGETYKGISRKFWPKWEGWSIVDKHIPLNNGDIIKDDILDEMVKDFYKKSFWNINQLDTINDIIPDLAERLFDVGVNMGILKPIKFLQTTINLLNRGKRENIDVDGKIGPNTIKELQECIKNNPPKRVLTVFAVCQGGFYKELMEKNESQKKFVGWWDRVRL